MDPTIRDLFPAARKFAYLNSAAVGPISTVTSRAVHAQLADVAENGSTNMNDWLGVRESVRTSVASLLGGGADDIAFLRNTTDGICAVAGGLDWRQGDNIVSFEREFPANFYPWRCVSERHGVELRLVPEREGRIDLDELCSMIDGRTRVVALSAIQYCSGFKADLERVGRVVRKHDALFVVDIIQAFGVTPLDLPAQYVDVAAGATYKWLCTPEGCGIFYINMRARQRITPQVHGWTSVGSPFDFSDREQRCSETARAWETGMGGSAVLYGLGASLDLINRAGVARIEEHLDDLTEVLCDSIRTAKFRVTSSRVRGERSQIVRLTPTNGFTAEGARDMLARDGILVSARNGCLRAAPHFFNDLCDIERLVAALS